MTYVPSLALRSSDATAVIAAAHPQYLRTLAPGELRTLRGVLRRERQRVCAEAISSGPTDDLCVRMNRLEALEEEIARIERAAPRRPGVRQVFTSFLRGASGA